MAASALAIPAIAGSSNYVHPQATLDAIIPALRCLAFRYRPAGVTFWLLGLETKGRAIEEPKDALAKPARLRAAAAPHTTLPY